MTTPAFTAAREYAQLLLRQHELDPRGEKDSAELNAICEAMNPPWDRMDGRFRSLMKGLSIDLYALADGRRGKLMLPEHQDEWRKKGGAAHQAGDYDAVLEHLRQPFPYGTPLGLIQFLQGKNWARVGFPDVAVLFYDEASRTFPMASIFLLKTLEDLRRVPEAKKQAIRIIGDRKAEPHDILIASASLFVLAPETGPERKETMEKLITPLERILHEEQQDYWGDRDTEMFAARLLGFVLAAVNRNSEASKLLTDAIGRFPNDMTLMTSRAMVNFEANPQAAKSDFRAAVGQHATIVTPYLGLAWFMLQESDYTSLLRTCDDGLRFEGVIDSNRAWLFEWRGIALAETGASINRVEEEFSRAASLAPERIEPIQVNRTLALSRRQSANVMGASWRTPDLRDVMVDTVRFTDPSGDESYTPEMLLLG